jgi:hypothetical membrane protein
LIVKRNVGDDAMMARGNVSFGSDDERRLSLEHSEKEQLVSEYRTRTTVGAMLFVFAGLQYLVTEAIAALAWKTPTYNYAYNFISDLGATACPSTFQDRALCSPLHAVMNTGLIVQGVVFAIGAIALLPGLRVRWGKTLLVLALVHSVGVILVGLFPETPQFVSSGAVVFHLIGADLTILAGNVIAILVGVQHRHLKAPRWFGILSIVLGILGIVSFAILLGGMSSLTAIDGALERMAVYTIMVWELLVGFLVLARLRRRHPQMSLDQGA